jgi:hypothetical protein
MRFVVVALLAAAVVVTATARAARLPACAEKHLRPGMDAPATEPDGSVRYRVVLGNDGPTCRVRRRLVVSLAGLATGTLAEVRGNPLTLRFDGVLRSRWTEFAVLRWRNGCGRRYARVVLWGFGSLSMGTPVPRCRGGASTLTLVRRYARRGLR